MQKISDKELLAFCSLAKLKLEFSQYKYKEKDEQGKDISTYKTIDKLIDLELKGQEERSKNSELKTLENEIDELNKKLVDESSKIKDGEDETEEYKTIYSQIKSKIMEYTNKANKIKEPEKTEVGISESKNIGLFFDDSNDSKFPFLYRTSDDLRKTAPMLMEYYDTPLNKESEFLKNWEVVYAGDSYEISKRIFTETVNYLKETDAERKMELAKIPTRKSISEHGETKKVIKMAMNIVQFATNVYFARGAAKPKLESKITTSTKTVQELTPEYKKYLSDKGTYKKLRKTQNPTIKPDKVRRGEKSIDVIQRTEITEHYLLKGDERISLGATAQQGQMPNHTKMTTDEHVKSMAEEAIGEWRVGSRKLTVAGKTNYAATVVEAKEPLFGDLTKFVFGNKIYNQTDDFLKESSMEYSIPFENNGISVVLLRRQNTKDDYVLVIEANWLGERNIETQLNKGNIPKEIHMIIRLVKSLSEDNDFKDKLFLPLVFTGTESSGKLATVLGLVNLNKPKKEESKKEESKKEESKKEEPEVIIRVFYKEKPSNLTSIPNFTYGDISHYLGDDIGYENYGVIKELGKEVMYEVAVLVVAAMFSSASGVIAGFSNPVIWVLTLFMLAKSTFKNIIKEEEYKKIYKILLDAKIINGTDGEVNLKGLYNFEIYSLKTNQMTTLKLDLASYIQMEYYTQIKKMSMFLYDDTTIISENITKKTIREKIDAPIVETTVINYYLEYSNNSINSLEIKSLRIYEEERSSLHDNNIEGELVALSTLTKENKTIEDNMGFTLKSLLELFESIQKNVSKTKVDIKYIAKNKPQKIERFIELSYEAATNNAEKLQKNVEYNYFPYIDSEGNIPKNPQIRDEYIGSFLRSLYRDEQSKDENEYSKDSKGRIYDKYYDKYYDRSLPPISQSSPPLGSNKENINTVLKEEIENRGKQLELPHCKAVVERLNGDNWKEILEKYWEVEEHTEKGRKKYTLILGQLKGKEFNKDAITYSYNLNYKPKSKDKILSRAVSLNLKDDYSFVIGEAALTQVADGATLVCSNGEGELNLIVTSQNFSYIEDSLEATEEDSYPTRNIMPNTDPHNYTKCKNNKMEPCINHIKSDFVKWQEVSKENNVNGIPVLLQNSYRYLHCGGRITIKKANTRIKSE